MPMNLPSFVGQKVLVTGASGFIGRHLCDRLTRSGAEVHGISRKEQGQKIKGLKWWQADLSDLDSVRHLLTSIKPEVIFHLAGDALGGREMGLVMPMFQSHLMSTVNLFLTASEIGCRRLIVTGSLEEPVRESPDAIPSSPYAMAKWSSTLYARMFHALYHLPVVVLRIFMVYGPAQRNVNKLLPYVILCLLRGETPRLSTGERPIDWIYIDDVIDGFLAAAHVPSLEGQTFDMGSGRLVPIRDVVGELVNLINPDIKPEFGALPDRPLEQMQVADTSKTWTMFNWRPRTSLPDGLRKTVHWYEAQLRQGGV